MTTPALISALVVVLVLAAVVGGLVFYALRNKGDVRAEFSHGSTMFKLEAKERPNSKTRPGLRRS